MMYRNSCLQAHHKLLLTSMVDILESFISITSILLFNEISIIFTFLFLYPAAANFKAALNSEISTILEKKGNY